MLTYDLQRSGTGPKYYALYRFIKGDIAGGVIGPGERLPSKRTLAAHLGVSTVTVENAYQLLLDEGYIYARERSGYFVRAIGAVSPAAPKGREPLRLLPEEKPPAPAGANFPYSQWFKIVRRVMSEQGRRLVARSPNKGCAVLRNAIAQYLLRYRGMHAQPEQIIVG